MTNTHTHSLVLDFKDIDETIFSLVGGKGANLGVLTRMAGIRVPDGFCISTEVYRHVIQDVPALNGLLDRLLLLKAADRNAIRELSGEIRTIIEALHIPEYIQNEIIRFLSVHGEKDSYAVRSSATAEDLPTASFAGQQDTYLNIIGAEEILKHIRKCWASLFTERAVVYRIQQGFDHRSVLLSVLVQKMVFPQASGILFTADPVSSNRKVVSIDAGFGLGEALVSGLVNTDVYKVRDGNVTDKKIAVKKSAIHARSEGGTQTLALPTEQQHAQVLSEQQILDLARIGRTIEAHFESPQDIEWCLADDVFYIVQSRPITTLFPVPEVQDQEPHVYVSVGHQQMMTDAMKPLGLSVWQHTAMRPMFTAGGRLFVDVAQNLASPATRDMVVNALGKSDPLIKDALLTILERGDFIKVLQEEKKETTEIWEKNFIEKNEMWGFEPAPSAVKTNDFFIEKGVKTLLIPGIGYGRNAQVFREHGIEVTGIEISKTAIELARKHYGPEMTIHHGSVTDMPFDKKRYGGIFCYALIHLLDERERKKLIRDCFNQLEENGHMVFVAISKEAHTYGKGKQISKDRYEVFEGVKMFFYDRESIQEEFGNAGLTEVAEIKENYPFYLITCKKTKEAIANITAVSDTKKEDAQKIPAVAPSDPLLQLENNPSIVSELMARTEKSIETLTQTIHTKSGVEALDFILEDIQQLKKLMSDPQSTAVLMAGMDAAFWINEKMLEWLGEKNAADVLAQSVPNNITSEMGLDLMDVADVIRPNPEVIKYLQQVPHDDLLEGLLALQGGMQAREAIEKYLKKYGMRCTGEIDVTKTRWRENPGLLVPALLTNIKTFEEGERRRRFERGRQEAQKKEQDLLERLKQLPEGDQKATETKRRIDLIRNFSGYREYPKYGIVNRYFVYKQALLKEAARLMQTNVIREQEDIYYLSLEELREVIRRQTVDYTRIDARKEAYKHFEKLRAPRVMTSEGEVFSGTYKHESLPEGAIAGLAVSSGVIEGRARVILNMEDAELEEGDILVTAFTDPSWTPLFVSIKGLVTEVGGLMTHGAVIAREYGLPAVVGVEHATRRIQDGQRIRVNGTEGYVLLVITDNE